MHTLSISDLRRTLSLFAPDFREVQNVLQDRIDLAKDIIALKRKDLDDEVNYVDYEDSSILWMKSRWRQLFQIKVINVFNL